MNHLAFKNYTDFVHAYLSNNEKMTQDQLKVILNKLKSMIVFPEGDFNIFFVSCNFEDEEINPEDVYQLRQILKEKNLLYNIGQIIPFKELTSKVNLENKPIFKELFISQSKINSLDHEALRKEISKLIRITISLIHWAFIFIRDYTNEISHTIINHIEKNSSNNFLNSSESEEFELAHPVLRKEKITSTRFILKPLYKDKQDQISSVINKLNIQILHENYVISDFIEILFSEDFSTCKEVKFELYNNQVHRLFKILGKYFDGTTLSIVQDSKKFISRQGTLLKRADLDSAKYKNPYIDNEYLFDDFEKELQQIG